MTRRGFLSRTGGAVAASLPKGSFGQNPGKTSGKPNVLFFMSDDMRVELGCYRSRFHAQTSHLDALARAGVRFDRNYCQFPLCNPSRSSLLTGRHPTVTGVLGNRTAFRDAHPDWVSLPQFFQENGYVSLRSGKIFHEGIDDPKAWTEGGGVVDADTGAGGKARVFPPQQVPPKPADVPAVNREASQKAMHSDQTIVLDGNGEGNPDFHITNHAIEYLRKYRDGQYKDRPFFLGCGFTKPHSPPAAPQRFYDLYDPNQIQLTPDFAAWPTVPPGFPKAAIRMRNADLFIGRGASEFEAREVIQSYLASLSWTDWNVGLVLAELDRLGLRQNTIVVFLCDHGYQLGEKGKWSKAGSLFEMGTRVPLIIAAPHAAGNGRASFRTVQSLDLYPTLAELCGLPAPPGIEGRSLLPLLHNPAAVWKDPAYSVWSEDGKTLHGVAVRTEKWRYVEYGPNAENGALLFDSHADVLEVTNLADDPRYANVRAELSPLVRKYAARLGT